MIEGLNSISDLLRLYKIKEVLYLGDSNPSVNSQFVHALIKLYSEILEYQARMICHLSKTLITSGCSGYFEAK